jgi:hypothetical protein
MSITIFFTFPDTWGVPLEEVAAIFGVSRALSKNQSLSIWLTNLQDREELFHFDGHAGPDKLEEKECSATVRHEDVV